MSDVIEYKCPFCGGAMEFDSKSQHMKCLYCNTEMTVEEFQRTQKPEAETAAEKKTAEEKAAKKRAEKAQAEEQIAKTGANEISISATGNGVENVTKSIISAMSTSTGEGVTGFDVKA